MLQIKKKLKISINKMAIKFIIPFIIGAICISTISAQSNVMVYNANKFANDLKNHPIAMVAFYAPWCHYSQDMLPEYDAASLVVKYLPDVKLIKIDCWTDLKDEATCKSQGVLGFPTMKIFKYGVFYKDFNGPRKSYEIINEIFNVANTIY